MNDYEKETIQILETAVKALQDAGNKFDAGQVGHILDRARSDFGAPGTIRASLRNG